jgi:hypothetical protein
MRNDVDVFLSYPIRVLTHNAWQFLASSLSHLILGIDTLSLSQRMLTYIHCSCGCNANIVEMLARG